MATLANNEPQEWSGSPDPIDPDNFWIDDLTGERVCTETGERSTPRTYRDWRIAVNPYAPASTAWQAWHPDFEDIDDGGFLILSAATEQELCLLIDDELFNAAVEA